MKRLWARLRFASPGTLALGSGMTLVAAVGLDRIDPRASFLVGLLFGMAVGVGVLALGVWQRRQMRG